MNLFDNNMRRVITAAILGNALEIYDIVIYGFFASAIARNFFPQEDKITGLVSSFAIFFIGYLARPLGALFFGRIGDNFGRKPALLASISLMAISTCGIGLIPDYDTIGGPILLLLNLRLLQGFSCGGELIGSIIFLVEHAPKNQRGFYAALGIMGSGVAFLLASLIAWLIHISFSDAAVVSGVWRLPFLGGALIGWVGWFMRRRIPETELFQQTIRMPEYYLRAYSEYAKQLRNGIIIVTLTLFSAVLGYLIYVFMVTYMTSVLRYTHAQALSIIILSTSVLVLLEPLMGKLSDHIGRRSVMALALIGSVIWIWPYFWLLQQQNILLASLAQLVITLFASAYIGAKAATIVEIIPVHLRFTVSAFAYAVALSLFGGVTPLGATLLIKATHSPYSLALGVTLCALISAIAVYKVRETSGAPKYIKKGTDEDITQIAHNMLANGDSVEQVAAVTGLSKIEVAKIKL